MPSGSSPSIHQAQGYLCVCTGQGRKMCKLSIWILEDYGTTNWTLKHTISVLKLCRNAMIQFNYLDVDEGYTMIAVHLEWNLIFFVGWERTIIAYNMDNRKVYVIPTCYSAFFRQDVLPQNIYRPYYLPYVPLFSELESLAEE